MNNSPTAVYIINGLIAFAVVGGAIAVAVMGKAEWTTALGVAGGFVGMLLTPSAAHVAAMRASMNNDGGGSK